MTEPGVLELPLPDAQARQRIGADLDTNLLVEAGAGSGKTTALVGRMTALVATGTARVEQIAAVTFTRKAAAELRQRFQVDLERVLREGRSDPHADGVVTERIGRALESVDRAFIGTIHAFCARLLRERPLEVGLDPSFEELPVEEREPLQRDFWNRHIERLTRESDPVLEDLARAGVAPAMLESAFDQLVQNPDVHFPAEAVDPPSESELVDVRRELVEIVDLGRELMGDRMPDPEWDSLQKKLRKLHFTRDVTEWREPADLFDALMELSKRGPRGHQIVQKRWRNKELAKKLRDRVDDFAVGDTPARALVDRWRQHRYALALRLAAGAADAFAEYRLRTGKLDFPDLLVLAARLLRLRPGVRQELGERYRYLLVDEFQDTDPLQAEIMLLLASDLGEPQESADAWRTAVPRRGALFVVGDPKQSIYRFRRADIQLYGFVKRRFESFGAVVELTTNFRSRPPIGDLVNGVFHGPDFFPSQATPEQAAFEPLNTLPGGPVSREGVFVYDIAPSQRNKRAVATDDASRLASWIRHRIAAGERRPESFLILTRNRPNLSLYARALEERSVPVQVTGAGVGAEHEIGELHVLLECLVDPTNPVKVVAALVGLFFGIDYEQLLQHRLDGGGMDVIRPGADGHEAVRSALHTLHGWWRTSTRLPADILITRLVDELGLLPYTAAGDLGALRAGALMYALDAVRASVLAGDASLPGALGAMRSALDLREAEAPLEPGRPNVVRLMNLHQAKGLEADVVVLADPSHSRDRATTFHTVRRDDGAAEGYLSVVERTVGFGGNRILAAPAGWEDKEGSERRFDDAEEVRLLYVAVTRARDELVVARWPDGRESAWAPLDPWLEEHAERLPLEIVSPAPRESVELTAESAADEAEGARARIERSGRPTYRHLSVTELAKSSPASSPAPGRGQAGGPPDQSYRGRSWGSAVHGALAAGAAEGSTLETLRATCRDLLVETERPLDDHGEPTELDELIELVRAVRGSELWARARACERMLVEVPFASPGASRRESAAADEAPATEPGERRQLDLFGDVAAATPGPGAGIDSDAARGGERVDDRRGVAGRGPAADPEDRVGTRVLEGVIDLAFREPDGWVIADYKTDLGTDPEFEARARSYRRQVELYADAWSELTGEPVKERVLFYTAQGHTEVW